MLTSNNHCKRLILTVEYLWAKRIYTYIYIGIDSHISESEILEKDNVTKHLTNNRLIIFKK